MKRRHTSETIEKMRKAATGKRTSSHGFHVGARLYSLKKHASERGLEWSITDDVAKDLIAGACRYCGIASVPVQAVLKKGTTWTMRGVNGIDRVDSAKGYTLDNCVSCCPTCNLAKRTMSVEDFVAWIDRVHAHLSSNPF